MNRFQPKTLYPTHSEWMSSALYVAVTTMIFTIILTVGLSSVNGFASPNQVSASYAAVKADMSNRYAVLKQTIFRA